MSLAELASWMGVGPPEPLPPGSHAYLFSGFGNATGAAVTLAKRSALVLVASGVALLGSLLLIYLPVLRKLPIILAFAIALTGLGLVEKELAPLFLQAAVVGVTLMFVAMLLRRVPWFNPPLAQHDTDFSVDSSLSATRVVPERSGGSSRQLRMPASAPAIPVPESQR
jgi:hypothetical protein